MHFATVIFNYFNAAQKPQPLKLREFEQRLPRLH